jgi:hypothetical protein
MRATDPALTWLRTTLHEVAATADAREVAGIAGS